MEKWSKRIKKSIYNVGSFLVLLFQYLPTSSYWYGLMSIPLLAYMILFIPHPLRNKDLIGLFQLEYIFFLFAIGFSIYCWIYLYHHRSEGLVSSGPYRNIRHPSYLMIILAIMIMTQSTYVHKGILNLDHSAMKNEFWIFIIMGIEIIIYIFLAFIEEYALNKRYPERYRIYKKQTWRFFPKIFPNTQKTKFFSFKSLITFGFYVFVILSIFSIEMKLLSFMNH